MNWVEQRALVTGGTRGIARALLLALQARDASVWATGRSQRGVAQAALKHPAVHWRSCDRATAMDRRPRMERVERENITMLIPSAGVQEARDFTADGNIEPMSHSAETAINLLAPIDIAREALPLLLRHPEAVIDFVASGLALAPKPPSPVVCAPKAGLRSFAKALHGQLRAKGWPLRIVEALPVVVDTDMIWRWAARQAGRKQTVFALATVSAADLLCPAWPNERMAIARGAMAPRRVWMVAFAFALACAVGTTVLGRLLLGAVDGAHRAGLQTCGAGWEQVVAHVQRLGTGAFSARALRGLRCRLACRGWRPSATRL